MNIKALVRRLFFHKKGSPKVKVLRVVYNGPVVAKYLGGIDINSYMYEDTNDRPDCCPICHNTLRKIPNLEKKFYVKNLDFGYTYDGYCIVSAKFKEFCDKGGYPNLLFVPLKSKGLFYFEPQDVYRLDYDNYTKFSRKRQCCGTYDEITGRPRITAKGFTTKNNDFIMRSEYMLGSFGSKGYAIIVGTATVMRMKEYGLRRVYASDSDKIYSSDVKVHGKEVEIDANKIIFWDIKRVKRILSVYGQKQEIEGSI